MTARRVVIGLMSTLTLVVASCGEDDATTAADEPGIEHVHGLDVDPTDDSLYAATDVSVKADQSAGHDRQASVQTRRSNPTTGRGHPPRPLSGRAGDGGR